MSLQTIHVCITQIKFEFLIFEFLLEVISMLLAFFDFE